MILPISIRFRTQRFRGELIEIASGPYLGHFVGTMSPAVDPRGEVLPDTYSINNVHYVGLEAACHGAMAAAYAYVAAELSVAATHAEPAR